MSPLPAPAEKPSHRVSESQSHAKLSPPAQVAVFCAALWPNLQPALTIQTVPEPMKLATVRRSPGGFGPQATRPDPRPGDVFRRVDPDGLPHEFHDTHRSRTPLGKRFGTRPVACRATTRHAEWAPRQRGLPTEVTGDTLMNKSELCTLVLPPRNETVAIAGFGTFSTRSRAARQGRNPRTGEHIAIAASKAPAFKAGKKLRDTVNQTPA